MPHRHARPRTAYKRFDRARSRAVVRWAPEAMLADLNALAYERDDVYHPAGTAFRSWGSFSHLRTRPARVAALAAFGAVTTGPVLVSFLDFRVEGGAGHASADRRAENFSVFIGYYHFVSGPEFRELVSEAGLEIIALNTDETESSWPHAVVRRALRPPPISARDGAGAP